MSRNYFKIMLRNLVKNKVSTGINLLGLSLGITTSLIVFFVISYEVSFDSFHSRKDRIFRIVKHVTTPPEDYFSSSLPFPMGGTLANDFPELITTQIFSTGEFAFELGADKWVEDEILFADSMFLKVFDFEVISGNANESLKHPNTVLVTETFAAKHFGDKSPIGETIGLVGGDDFDIVGVLKDPPGNSHLSFSMVISVQSFNKDFVGGLDYDSWNTTLGFSNYILLPGGETPTSFEKKLGEFASKYWSEDKTDRTQLLLQPLNEIHLDPRYAGSNPGYTVDTTYLWILGSIGLFVLLLACINFINLSTALSVRKSKEVGVRKVLGASRTQLVYQYLGEAFLLTSLSLIISLGITERVLPLLNNFMDSQISFDLLQDGAVIYFLVATLLFVTLFSGLYPASVLSSFKPVEALKNKINSHSGASQFLRKALVTSQFVISQILIIGTVIVAQQMDYFRSKPLGFDRENIVATSLDDRDEVKLSTFKTRLLSNSAIHHVTFGMGAPTSENDIGTNIEMEGHDEDFRVRIKAVDFDYNETFGLEMSSGRWFLKDQSDGGQAEFILNEAAIHQLGYSSEEEVIGKIITIGVNRMTGPVVGVVKDFHMKPLQESIQPAVLLQFPFLYFEAGIKISNNNIPETIDFIKSTWEETFPGGLFDYYFLDDALAKNYEHEERIYTMFKIFSVLAIGIGCLGLFGLLSFMVIQKTKEVGVRKVLGATVGSIVFLFSKDFMRLLLFAFIIATPVSWYLMNIWLDDFAYKIDVNPLYFVLGGFINLVIALFTISYQSIKAAVANPVESLKDE